MGLMDFIKGQLIEVIEWTDESSDTIVYRFPAANKEIKMGAKLTVRESQTAVFINEGQLADIFIPGHYELYTNNLPVLTKLKSWKYGFNSPFKAEVYFINTKQFIDQKWGTQSPVPLQDPKFGQLEVRARGLYSFKVIDCARFMCEIFGTRSSYSTEDITNQLRSYIVQYMKDTMAESKLSFFELQSQLVEFSKLVKENLREKFDQFGFDIVDLTIDDFSLPQELQEAFRQGSKINLMGGIDTYSKIRTLDAVNSAAENKGNGSFAGMGAGLGAGATIGNMMGQMFNNNQQNQQSVQNPPQKSIACPKCNAQVQTGAKFCPDCGNAMAPKKALCVKCNSEINNGAKFCPQCGASQEQQELLCSNCGNKLTQGSKFCPECGTKV